jgi:hypothetical protein
VHAARDCKEHTIKNKTKNNNKHIRLLGRLPLPLLRPIRHRTRGIPPNTQGCDNTCTCMEDGKILDKERKSQVPGGHCFDN